MKKIYLFCLTVICILLAAAGCEKKDTKDTEETTEKETVLERETLALPEDCKVVTDVSEFVPVSENQAYNLQTDDNQGMIQGGSIVNAGDKIYYKGERSLGDTSMPGIEVFDKISKSNELLCQKADCEHNLEDCISYYDTSDGIAYQNDALYEVSLSDKKLTKVSFADGTRQRIHSLLGLDPKDVVTNPKYSGAYNIGSYVIHRGYVYYIYDCWSDETEENFHLNYSNCLFRLALDGSSEPEFIMAVPYERSLWDGMRGSGSYIYMILGNLMTEDQMEPESMKYGGVLYRYNTEAGEMEKFETLGNDIVGFAATENGIYYITSTGKSEIHYYDFHAGESSVFATDISKQQSLLFDGEYLYTAHRVAGVDKCKIKVSVWNLSGEKVADIPLLEDTTENGTTVRDSFYGADEKYVYLYRQSYNDQSWSDRVLYMEKTDMLTANYEFYAVKTE